MLTPKLYVESVFGFNCICFPFFFFNDQVVCIAAFFSSLLGVVLVLGYTVFIFFIFFYFFLCLCLCWRYEMFSLTLLLSASSTSFMLSQLVKDFRKFFCFSIAYLIFFFYLEIILSKYLRLTWYSMNRNERNISA